MLERRKLESGLTLLVLVVAACGCCLPLISSDGNWFHSHEDARYLYLFHHFREAFLEGNLYPRWLANLYGGYGYPTFIYYQPGFFHAAIPFSLLFPYPFFSMKFTIGFFFFLGGSGAYLLARRLTKSDLYGLFGALCFLLTPYLYTNVYVRGDLSEFAAMTLTPWPYFFALLARRVQHLDLQCVLTFSGLTVSLACLISMHPSTALFFTVAFGIFTLASFVDHEKNLFFLTLVGLAFFSALVLSSPYWLTFWRMQDSVDLFRLSAGWFHPTQHLVNLEPLLSSEWKYGPSPWGLPIQLGWPHLVLAVGGAIASKRLRFMKATAATYFGMILGMTYLAYPLWRFLPVLNFVQFPWRLLSVIAVLQLICICGLSQLLASRSSTAKYSILLVLAIGMVLLARHQFQVERTIDVSSQAIRDSSEPPFGDFQSLSSLDDFLPKTVLEKPATPRKDDLMLRHHMGGPARIEPLPGHSAYHVRARVLAAAEDAVVAIDQFYFPGMRISVSGLVLSTTEIVENLLRDGRMIVEIPEGSDVVVEVYYDGPPEWRANVVATALWFATLGIFFLVIRHKCGSEKSVSR